MIFQIFFYYYLKKKMCFHNKKYILLLFCFSSTPYLLHVCSTSIESQNEWTWYGADTEQAWNGGYCSFCRFQEGTFCYVLKRLW